MKSLPLKIFFFPLIFAIFSGCGIKKDPVPLPKPAFEVRRIGEKVYLIPGKEVFKAEGFLRRGKYFLRIDSKAFCFRVHHRLGRSASACVEEALRERPLLSQELTEDSVILNLQGFERYRIYRVTGEGNLILEDFKEVRGNRAVMKREFKDYQVAVTGVRGSLESEPLLVKVPYEEVSFEVYRNGKLLTAKPIMATVFIEKKPDEPAVYEIVAINKFGQRSVSARVFYRP